MNSEQYYTRQGRKIQGPFDIDRLRQLASLGRFSRGHQVSTDRVSWFPASELTEIFGDTQPASRSPVAPPTEAAVELEFPSDSRKRGNYLALWIGIPVALLFLAVTIGGGIWWFVANKKVDRPSSLMITSMDNEKKLEDAVGLLVPYVHIVTKGGDVIEIILGEGSCFMVSSDGFALTNRHVIEDYQKLKKAETLGEIQEKQGHQSVESKLAAFFDGQRYPVDLTYVSDEFDMAILKIVRRKSPYFTLSESNPGRTTKVWSCGFPGSADIPSSKLEAAITAAREKNATRLRQYFSKGALKYSSRAGEVSKIFDQEGEGEMILHDAAISGGNSGGPLVSAEGIVYGINTSVYSDALFSLTLRQLRKEIDNHVPDAVWK